jgi:diguanylate cyclase (GGDEF)-like protein
MRHYDPHLEGDNTLRLTARTIQKHLRKTDIAFRYGGDELRLPCRRALPDG